MEFKRGGFQQNIIRHEENMKAWPIHRGNY